MSGAAGPQIILLANPSAGRGRAQRCLEVALPVLSRGANVEVLVPGGAAAAREQLAAALRGKDPRTTRLVAVGGDGTVHLALQAAVANQVPLGIIPAGSGNDGARAAGLPLADPAAAARVVLADRRGPCDLGLAVLADGTRAYFLCILSCGFDSAVNERANRMRWPHGRARYVRGVAAELPGFRPATFNAEIDGQPESEAAMLVSVANGGSYGGGMKLCPHADLHDGLLSGIWLSAIGKVDFLRTFPKVFAGTHLSHPAIRTFNARTVELAATGQVAYVDGERFGELPVTVTAEPGALTLIQP